jgi:hypothetical protein
MTTPNAAAATDPFEQELGADEQKLIGFEQELFSPQARAAEAGLPQGPEQQSFAFEQELKRVEERSRGLERELRGPERRTIGFESEASASERERTRLGREPRAPSLPEPRSLFVQDEVPRGRWRRFIGAAAIALVAAVAAGAYLYHRDGTLPWVAALVSPPAAPQAPASSGPRVVGEVGATPAAAAPAPETAPAPKALDAPAERRVTDDAGEPPAATPVPAAAPGPSCPPAVAAMALCDWLARANQQ